MHMMIAASDPPSFHTTTPTRLSQSYRTLFPDECRYTPSQIEDHEGFMANWLMRYEANPESAIATTNWMGKVTKALFHALHVPMPRTKRDRLIALQIKPL